MKTVLMAQREMEGLVMRIESSYENNLKHENIKLYKAYIESYNAPLESRRVAMESVSNALRRDIRGLEMVDNYYMRENSSDL